MEEIRYNTIREFNDRQGLPTLHPLVSVARVEDSSHIRAEVHHFGIYAIYLKENKGCKLSYGRTEYDFDEMTVTSFAPGQSVTVEPVPGVPVSKYTVLAFHPDLLNRTSLGRNISRYEFFDYTSNEALHLSAGEVEVFRGVLSMIDQELRHSIDKHTRELIVSNSEQVEPAEKGLDYAANNYAIGTEQLSRIKSNPESESSYPAIDPVDVDLDKYSTIIVTTPLWWSQMASNMQTFLFKYGKSMKGKRCSYSSGINGVGKDARH